MAHTLAIVIPAYKSQFLAEGLKSIVGQTCRNFNLYIGDDASPHPIAEVVSQFAGSLPIQYNRFPENLGGTNLVAHWNRCVALTQGEQWIWLFCDDDVMSPNCVENFYDSISKQTCSLVRFATQETNANLKPIKRVVKHPLDETGTNFLERKLLGLTRSSLSEYVFKIDDFVTAGGFVTFEAAWGSDDATWFNIGNVNGICSVNSSLVFIRQSGENISSLNNSFVNRQKQLGGQQFQSWLHSEAKDLLNKIDFERTWLNNLKVKLRKNPMAFGSHFANLISGVGKVRGKVLWRGFTFCFAYIKLHLVRKA